MPFKKRFTKKAPVRRVKKVFRKRPVRKVRFRKVEQSLRIPLQQLELFQEYTFPSTLVKQAGLSNGYQTNFNTEQSLSAMLFSSPAFTKWVQDFNWVRCSHIKVELIPEVIDGTSFNDATGEKPRLHWINDEGSAGIANRNTDKDIMTIEYAKSVGQKYHEAQFIKPYVFNIKPYRRLDNALTTTSDAYKSSNQWTPSLGITLPNSNFYFGFTNVANDFKYKTVITFTLHWKQPFQGEA